MKPGQRNPWGHWGRWVTPSMLEASDDVPVVMTRRATPEELATMEATFMANHPDRAEALRLLAEGSATSEVAQATGLTPHQVGSLRRAQESRLMTPAPVPGTVDGVGAEGSGTVTVSLEGERPVFTVERGIGLADDGGWDVEAPPVGLEVRALVDQMIACDGCGAQRRLAMMTILRWGTRPQSLCICPTCRQRIAAG